MAASLEFLHRIFWRWRSSYTTYSTWSQWWKHGWQYWRWRRPSLAEKHTHGRQVPATRFFRSHNLRLWGKHRQARQNSPFNLEVRKNSMPTITYKYCFHVSKLPSLADSVWITSVTICLLPLDFFLFVSVYVFVFLFKSITCLKEQLKCTMFDKINTCAIHCSRKL